MTEVAQEYMRQMGLTNTPYIVVRHFDPSMNSLCSAKNAHPHCHIVFSRVDYDGKILTQTTNFKKNERVCKALNLRHRLTQGKSKLNTNVSQKGTSQVVKKPVSQKPIMPTPSDTPKTKPQSKSVVIPPLPDGFMGARIAPHDLDRYQRGEAICVYIYNPDDIVGKHHWIWYDFKTCQPRCELTPPPADRCIPDTFKQSQSLGNVSSSHTQGAGINLSSSSFSGNPIPGEGFAHGSALPDDFKLWLSRHPGLSIDEALHRNRDEQKAKQRRKGLKL